MAQTAASAHANGSDAHTAIIRSSELFDESWYRRNNFGLLSENDDAAIHYLEQGPTRLNSALRFCGEEYLALNPDVSRAKMNPLLHYERYGRSTHRKLADADGLEPCFPADACSCSHEWGIKPRKHGRTAIVSCYFENGTIPETLLYLLRGLREVADNIVLIGDCPVLPQELNKLDGLVCHAMFQHHGQYDFGSYKRGLAYARHAALLTRERIDELVLINDSCIGPVYPFAESFAAMKECPCDFWGYVAFQNAIYSRHLSSFFLVFRNVVLDSVLLDRFMLRVTGNLDRGEVIERFETLLTPYLTSKGFSYAAVIENSDSNSSIFYNPVTFLKQLRIPLVKKKAFSMGTRESLSELRSIIQKQAPALYRLIDTYGATPPSNPTLLPTLEEHQASLPAKVDALRSKFLAGRVIHATFLVMSATLFSARELFFQMLDEPLVELSLIVIPDLRKGARLDHAMERCKDELITMGCPPSTIALAQRDKIGRWYDACAHADLVVYSHPLYYASSFRYSPLYSLGKRFVPIMAELGSPYTWQRVQLLEHDSYACMWKVFFTNEQMLQEYAMRSSCNGYNALRIPFDYSTQTYGATEDMDSRRPTILIPLDSPSRTRVQDGSGEEPLDHLSSFYRTLPDSHEDVDFIYWKRPLLSTDACISQQNGWEAWEAMCFVRELSDKPNVTWFDEETDPLRLFSMSDGCITACEELLFMYTNTQKPSCYVPPADHAFNNVLTPLGEEHLANCSVAKTDRHVEEFISQLTNDWRFSHKSRG